MKKKASRNQILGSFGYAMPDKYCEDFVNGSIASNDLNYRLLGCLCCDNLKSEEHPSHCNKRICLSCGKGHTLVAGVLKEDEEA